MPKRCGQEMCPNWSGDGRVCTCVLLGIEPVADAEPGDHLGDLYDAALPTDAPGAWIRRAIERMRADA